MPGRTAKTVARVPYGTSATDTSLHNIVEIEESLFGKKNGRGELHDGQWVFGGVLRGTGECFLVPVDDLTFCFDCPHRVESFGV